METINTPIAAAVKQSNLSIGYDKESLKELMKTSIDVMAAVCMPEIATEVFPDVYQYLWKRYTEALLSEERDFSKFGLALPRGHGKTMFLKLLIAFCVFFTKRHFILVVCAAEGLAEDIISDVEDVLDSSNVINLFGNWRNSIERDTLGFKKFIFNGEVKILKGLGENSKFRGTNIKNFRPDVMLFDDAQSADCAESAEVSRKFQKKFFGTMLKAKSPLGCFYLYIGNMYPNVVIEKSADRILYACLLRNLKDNPEWETVIVGAILEDWTALWEAVFPLKILLAEFRNDFNSGNGAVFASEVLNDPDFILLTLFDPSKVPVFPYTDFPEEPIAKFIVLDPSLGKKKSDDQIAGLFYVYEHLPVLMEIKNYKLTSPEMAIELVKWSKQEGVPLLAIEDYAMQGTIIQWIDFAIKQAGIRDFKVVGINRGQESKVSSILNFFKEVMGGEIFLHPNIKSIVYDQILEFKPNKPNNRDDILDVGAYGNKVFDRYRDLCYTLAANDRYDNEGDIIQDRGLNWGTK